MTQSSEEFASVKSIEDWLFEVGESAPIAMKYDDSSRSAKGIIADSVIEISQLRARVAELEKDKQALFHSLHEAFFYEGGADSALDDEYVMARMSGLIDAHKEAFDLQSAAGSFLGQPVTLVPSNGCAEDRIKRCVSGAIDADGACMYCDADQGVACRASETARQKTDYSYALDQS